VQQAIPGDHRLQSQKNVPENRGNTAARTGFSGRKNTRMARITKNFPERIYFLKKLLTSSNADQDLIS